MYAVFMYLLFMLLKQHFCVPLSLVSEKEIKQWHKGFLKDCPNGLLTEQVRAYYYIT